MYKLFCSYPYPTSPEKNEDIFYFFKANYTRDQKYVDTVEHLIPVFPIRLCSITSEMSHIL